MNEQAEELVKAVAEGDLLAAREMIRNGVDLNEPVGKGEFAGATPLHVAACKGRAECVKLLLESGADANVKDGNGKTPLRIAVSTGHVECVKLLVEHTGRIDDKIEALQSYAQTVKAKAEAANAKIVAVYHEAENTEAGHRVKAKALSAREKLKQKWAELGVFCNANPESPIAKVYKYTDSHRIQVMVVLACAVVGMLAFSSGDSVSRDSSGRVISSYYGKEPEMTLNQIADQLKKYTSLGDAVVGVPMGPLGFYQEDDYHAYCTGEDFLRHVNRYNDGLDKCADYPYLSNVMYYAYSSKDKLPIDKYVRSLLSMGADINQKAEIFCVEVNEGLSFFTGDRLLEKGVCACTPLSLAVSYNDVKAVEILLKEGADPNQSYGAGMFPLELCSDVKICEMLIDADTDVNAVDENGHTAMGYAAKYGALEVIKLLQNAGGHAKPADGELLVNACEKGQTDIVEILLEEGANPNAEDKLMNNAVYNGHLDIVRALLDAGANPDAGLVQAVSFERVEAIKLLVGAGASVGCTLLENALKRQNNEVIEALKPALDRVKATNSKEDGHALCAAVDNNQIDFVRALLKAGVSPNSSGISGKNLGWSQYGRAIDYAIRTGNMDILRLLVESGANLEDVDLQRAAASGGSKMVQYLLDHGAPKISLDNCHQLASACENGQVEYVKALLLAGANPDSHLLDGLKTALQYACIRGDAEIVRALLAAGADVNKDDGRLSAIGHACANGHVEVVKILKEAGADLDLKYNSVLVAACGKNGSADAVKLLLEYGVNVDVSHLSETALMCASENGRADIVKVLLEAGANADGTSDGSYAPLWLASRSGNVDCVKLLLSAGAKQGHRYHKGDSPYSKYTEIEIAEEGHHSEVVELLKQAKQKE